MSEEEHTWSLKLLGGKEIWNGKLKSSPTVKELSTILRSLPDSSADQELSYIAAQVARSCPSKNISTILSVLSCHFWRNTNGDIDINKLNNLHSTIQKRICAYVFKKGDLCWTCRTCGKDQTCVQCDKCFQKSDHKGHEVFFHTSTGEGGCCDCGDPEAWCATGNCSEHCGPDEPNTADETLQKPTVDAISTLHPDLYRGLLATIYGAFGVFLSYIGCTVRGFEPYSTNPFISWCDLFDINLVGRLHNDDIHTYDEVTSILRQMGIDSGDATILTTAVDKLGEAKAITTKDTIILKAHSDMTKKINLLYSIVPEDIVNMESSMIAILTWLQNLGSGGHVGLRSVVTAMFMKNVTEYPKWATVLEAENDSDITDTITECAHSVATPCLFHETTVFPSIITPLQYSKKNDHLKDLLGLYKFGSKYLQDYAQPFQYCPQVSFAICMCASPFVSDNIRKILNLIVMQYQHDLYFKTSFSQLFMYLYPTLHALFIRFVGTEKGTIFHTTVQVFTAYSVVESLSSDSMHLRVFPTLQSSSLSLPSVTSTTLTSTDNIILQSVNHLSLSIMNALVMSLSHLGIFPNRTHHLSYYEHAIFICSTGNRIFHLFRDLEYIFKNPVGCTRILSGERDPGVFELIIKVHSMVQNLDKYRRRTSTHIETENDQWSITLSLVFEIEAISTNIMSHAFVPYISTNKAWGYHLKQCITPLLSTTTCSTTTNNNNNNNSTMNIDPNMKQNPSTTPLATTITTTPITTTTTTATTNTMPMNNSEDINSSSSCSDDYTLYQMHLKRCILISMQKIIVYIQNNLVKTVERAVDTSMEIVVDDDDDDDDDDDNNTSLPTMTTQDTYTTSLRLQEDQGEEMTSSIMNTVRALNRRTRSTALREVSPRFTENLSNSTSLNINIDPNIVSHDDEDEDSSHFFNSDQPVSILGHMVVFPGIRRYYVSYHSVSVNIPIQRLVSKLCYYACMGGVDLSEMISYLKQDVSKPILHYLADYPLRCLSFIAQVNANMWKRNGNAVLNIAYNYRLPHRAKMGQLVDWHAIQLSILSLGYDPILALALDRYELLTFLDKKSSLPDISNEKTLEYKGTLLVSFLKTLSNIIIYVPTILIKNDSTNEENKAHMSVSPYETLHLAVAREIAHMTIVGEYERDPIGRNTVSKPISFTKLISVKYSVGTPKHVSEALVRTVTSEYCTSKTIYIEEEESIRYELSPKAYDLINLQYDCWNTDEQNKAIENMKLYRQRQINEKNKKDKSTTTTTSNLHIFYPVISEKAIPIAHPDFQSIRQLLYRPLFCTILHRALSVCVSNMYNWVPNIKKSIPDIVIQIIHIVTLQIHCHKLLTTSKVNTNDATIETGTAHRFYTHAFKPPTTTTSTETDVIYMYDNTPTASDDSGYGYPLLESLIAVHESGIIKDDEYYHNGLHWIFKNLSELSSDAKQLLQSKGLIYEETSSNSSSSNSEVDKINEKKALLAKKKAAAQKKALAAMNKQASNFSTMMNIEEDEEDENEVGDNKKTSGDKKIITSGVGGGGGSKSGDITSKPVICTLEDDASTCIVCQDKSNHVIGYLCYIQPSKSLTHTLLNTPNDPISEEMKSTYRVVSATPCKVHKSPQETSQVIGELQPGEHIRVLCRQGVWVQINSGGWCSVWITRDSNMTTTSSSSTEAVSLKTDYIIQLTSMENMYSNKHGSSRVHVSTCGHMMHSKCWSTFRPNPNPLLAGFDSNRQYDERRGEIVCPLCKAVCNSLLPHIPPHLSGYRMYNPLIPTNNDMEIQSINADTSLNSTSIIDELIRSDSNNMITDQITTELFKILNNDNTIDSLSFNRLTYRDHYTQLLESINDFTINIRFMYKLAWNTDTDRDYVNVLEVVETVKNVRTSHSMWSATAYTVLISLFNLLSPYTICSSNTTSTTQNSDITTVDTTSPLKDVNDGVEGDDNTKINSTHVDMKISIICKQLMNMLILSHDTVLAKPTHITHMLSTPIISLLSGEINSLVKICMDNHSLMNDSSSSSSSSLLPSYTQDCHYLIPSQNYDEELLTVLLSLPFTPINTFAIPDIRRLTMILGTIYDKSACNTMELWGIFTTPLLGQDLCMMVMMCVSISSNRNALYNRLIILIYARYIQVLLEPQCSGIYQYSPTNSRYIPNMATDMKESETTISQHNDNATQSVSLSAVTSHSGVVGSTIESSPHNKRRKANTKGNNTHVYMSTTSTTKKSAKVVPTDESSTSSTTLKDDTRPHTHTRTSLKSSVNVTLDTIGMTEKEMEMVQVIDSLRNHLYSLMSIPINNQYSLKNRELLTYVLDSLAFFLLYIQSIKNLMVYDMNPNTCISNVIKSISSTSSTVNLQELSISSKIMMINTILQDFSSSLTLDILLTSPILNVLAIEWMKQYKNAYFYRPYSGLCPTTTTTTTNDKTVLKEATVPDISKSEDIPSTSSSLYSTMLQTTKVPLNTTSTKEELNEDSHSNLMGETSSHTLPSLKIRSKIDENHKINEEKAAEEKEEKEEVVEEGVMSQHIIIDDSDDNMEIYEKNWAMVHDSIAPYDLTRMNNDDDDNDNMEGVELAEYLGEEEEEWEDEEEEEEEEEEEDQFDMIHGPTDFDDENEFDDINMNQDEDEYEYEDENISPTIVQDLINQINMDPTTLQVLQQLQNVNVINQSYISWKLVGVDPTYTYIDDVSDELFLRHYLNNIHSIIPYQGSLIGMYTSYDVLCKPMPSLVYDISHFNLTLRHSMKLIDLPHIYTDLYFKTKFPNGRDKPGIEEPCICLICGRILHAGNNRTSRKSGSKSPGECTLHARQCNDGIGVFFLVQHMSILLMNRAYSCYYPTIYLDANGEIDKVKGRNRPMYLSSKRYQRIQEIYQNHQIPIEVTRSRVSKGFCINLDYY